MMPIDLSYGCLETVLKVLLIISPCSVESDSQKPTRI